MFSRFTYATSINQCFIPFYGWITFHSLYGYVTFCLSIISRWTFKLFLHFSYYELLCYELLYSFCVDISLVYTGIPRFGWNCWVIWWLCLTFWGIAKLFYKQMHSLFFFPVSLHSYCYDLLLSILVGKKWYFTVVLIFISIMNNNVEHLYIEIYICVCIYILYVI